ncbi:MAG: two-component system, NarL family, response regulator DesR [Cryptosporangiaceae bacterium]|nr:two-component system, NarL family, response regulator DesR [Cryptosporangiaceae bacterium]
MIRILLAEPMHLIRSGLVALLRDEDDITVVAELDHGDRVVPAALALKPQVAVLAADLPGRDGLSVAQELHERLPECRNVILTSLRQASALRRAMNNGMLGFAVTEAAPSSFVECIRRAARGERVIDADLAVRLWRTASSPLTAREVEILRIAAEGAPTREIASRLYLSPGTVRNYLSTAVGKTGARNRIDAIRIASDSGWL